MFAKDAEAKIVVGPLTLTLAQGTMPPDAIRLWEDNPRIKHLVAQFEAYPTEEDLLAAIAKVQPTAYRNLYRDIEKFGQQEPVFLRAAEGEPVDTATVVEGNTRVAVLKQLHARFPHEVRFGHVKAYLLPPNFGDTDLAILMASYHVKGSLRNQWDRYQIGAFIHDEVEVKAHFTQAELAEHIGKSSSWISRHLSVFRFALEYRDQVESAYGLSPQEAETEVNRHFSLLEEAWKVKRFRDEMEENPEAKETLFRWVHEGKFRDHRAVRAIHDLYSDQERRAAIEEGERGAADDAASRIGKNIPLHEDLERLQRRIDGVQIGDLATIDLPRVRKTRMALEGLEAMLDGQGR